MGVAGGGIGMISLFNRILGIIKHPPIYIPNKTCLAYTHCSYPEYRKK